MSWIAKAQVFDIETDGLNPTKIHCLAVNSQGKRKATTNYANMRKFSEGSEFLVGHNIIRYDVPVLKRLLGASCNAVLVDTLALSWYLFPERKGKHGLEAWGEYFGVPKPVVKDWKNLSVQEYLHRCKQDVEINTLLWDKCLEVLLSLYQTEEEVLRLVKYLGFKFDCAREQEEIGWLLDVERCQEGLAILERDYEEKRAELSSVMPKVAVKDVKKRPANPYKISGELSVHGKAWFSFLEEHNLPDAPEHEYIKGYKEGNAGSIPQVKAWLFSLGWKPNEYKYNRNKKTGEIKEVPQINTQIPDKDGLSDSVKLLFDKEPKLKLLEGLYVIRHRKSLLEGFLKDVDENGYIRAQVQGFTNTLRFIHKVVLNLPAVDKPYGELVRGCLICPEGYELAGSDLSSLEDITKQHYMWDYDPEYVKEMTRPDYDAHLSLAESDGAITSQQAADYISGKDRSIKGIRYVYKQVNYACLYGAKPKRVALTAGIPVPQAARAVKAYNKKNWSVAKIAESCEVKRVDGKLWLFNPVSKLWYYLKVEKDRFSTLNQGTGSFSFDTWLKFVREGGPPIIGQMHDEFIGLVRKGRRERMKKHTEEALVKTNEVLKLNRELSCSIEFGNNYADIH